ncbi:hypothetical protein E2562_014620 [Oryza meyeriana var. granulata]|uniref:Uncharacterized protein n=1 Tax=Oryza meyeriana var. granulata TaxID=110450 RepID=A0A6G1DWV6_9ORYZ|nr:hypothetical protein E2562_014620 [Oryza meyeriana var. granulata]
MAARGTGSALQPLPAPSRCHGSAAPDGGHCVIPLHPSPAAEAQDPMAPRETDRKSFSSGRWGALICCSDGNNHNQSTATSQSPSEEDLNDTALL